MGLTATVAVAGIGVAVAGASTHHASTTSTTGTPTSTSTTGTTATTGRPPRRARRYVGPVAPTTATTSTPDQGDDDTDHDDDHTRRLDHVGAVMSASVRTAGTAAVRSLQAIGTTATVVVDDPAAGDTALELLADDLGALDGACSRFRADSELRRLKQQRWPADTGQLPPVRGDGHGL